ncbi:MAG: beta-lactamase family protein [Parvularculaceae bacterium]|nr:beta-lactamase family protein [Parvularculaceae bacterium]
MRSLLYVVLGIAAAALIGLVAYAAPAARVASAYVGKTLCSEIFIAGRDEAAVRRDDLVGIDPILPRVRAVVEHARSRVVASLFGLGRTVVVHRPGYGCTMVAGGAPVALPPPPPRAPLRPWPSTTIGAPDAPKAVDFDALGEALDAAIANETAKTRALLVVVDGRVVGARFAPGFSAETPFLSWSMAKSVTATLVGAAALKGHLNINEAAPVPEWKGDRRKAAISWNDLLRMQSGLAFSEVYGDPGSDASRMLFAARDAGGYAAMRPLIYAPGKVFAYSSGTTNLLMRTLRQVLASHGVELEAFAHSALFDPIGVSSLVMERDSSGAPIGSSYMYATVGDWARLGQLYLDDGRVGNVRILPEGWVAAATTPAAAADGRYGLQIWLNRPGAARPRTYPGAPETMFYFSGHEGQFVYVVPDRRMIVVRVGATRGADPETILAPSLAALIAAVEPRKAP